MKKAMFVLLCVFSCCLMSADDRPVFHVVLAVDTRSDGIKKHGAADLAHYEDLATRIAALINYKPDIQTLKGKDMTNDKLEEALRNIDASRRDIVLFLYSGHGSEYPGRSKWPVLAMEEIPKVGVAGKAVVNFLRKGKQRLTCIFFNACNGSPTDYLYDKKIYGHAPMLKETGDYPGIESLLLSCTGRVVATSSRKSEISYTNIITPYYGSLFLSALLDSLVNNAAKKDIGWESILEKTSEYCVQETTIARQQRSFFMIQHPYYKIHLDKGDS